MRLFVGYGYHERDKWVEDYVLPLLIALGCEVVHGKTVYGGALPDEVIKKIRTADAAIGFTTQREPIGDKFLTHPWVVQELTTAHTQDPRIPWVEVREKNVVSPGGILEAADFQRIDYRQEDLATCLVKISQAVKLFQDQTSITTVRLGPAPAVDQISLLLDDPTFVCTCQILRGAVQQAPRKIAVFPIRGGVFVQLRGVAPGELVRISVAVQGRIWRSHYESVDTVDIQVRE